MKLSQIILTTLLTVSSATLFAATTPAPAAETTPSAEQEVQTATIKSATSEAAVEEQSKGKTTAQ